MLYQVRKPQDLSSHTETHIFYREEDEEEAAITDPEGKAVKEKSDASKTTQQSDSKDSQVLSTY